MGMISDEELAAYTAVILLDLTPAPTCLDSALVRRVTGAIQASLQRLNELPADHPFWVKTNRRPTVFKANECERQRLAADPTDQRALWAVVSFTLLYCAYGAEQALRHLPEGDPRMIRWITGASEWVTLISGPDMADALRAAVLEVPGAPTMLEELSRSADPLDRRAARMCASVLAGSTVLQATHRL